MEMPFDRILGIVGVLGILIGAGVAIAVDPKSKGEMQFSVICFAVSGLALCLTVGIWVLKSELEALPRVVIGAFSFAVVCTSMVEASRWAVGRYERANSRENSATQRPQMIQSTATLEVKNPCRVENHKFVSCSDSEVVEWGAPLMARLNNAIGQYEAARNQAHRGYVRDHDAAALSNKLMENIDLNRYLESDYRNLFMYRAELASRVKGGDQQIMNPLDILSRPPGGLLPDGGIGISDQYSMLSEAQFIQRDLQQLIDRIVSQIHAAS